MPSRSCARVVDPVPHTPCVPSPFVLPERQSRAIRGGIADTDLHPPGGCAGRIGELSIALRAAAGAALPRLPRGHHHRADDECPYRQRSAPARAAGLTIFCAGLHHRVRRPRGRRLGAGPMDSKPQGGAVARRRPDHHRLRPAFPGHPAHFPALSRGADPSRDARRQSGGCLPHGSRLRLRLDPLHRAGAGNGIDPGGAGRQPSHEVCGCSLSIRWASACPLSSPPLPSAPSCVSCSASSAILDASRC